MTCRNCIHFKICKARFEQFGRYEVNWDEDTVEKECHCGDGFKDKTKFIELPCNIGDTVYEIYSTLTKDGIIDVIEESVISSFIINHLKNKYFISLLPYELHFNIPEFGRSVFTNRKEAEIMLEKKSN
jgi:hypothetical protein